MSIELPYAGPNHVWSIGEKSHYPDKGDADYPEDWDADKKGTYSVIVPALMLHHYYVQGQDSGRICGPNGWYSISLFTEENAKTFAAFLSDRGERYDVPVEPVGPWYSDEAQEVVRYEGGFLGIGRKKIVTHEKKLQGWQFKKPSRELYKPLPEGFTQRNVLEAAEDLLTEKRNKDHERALRMESQRHFGFYPPKKLSEQFPDKA